jgi:hypothetical protein
MANKSYNAEDHQKAFEIYYETRTYQRVVDKLGIDFTTVQRWADEKFKCRFNCPWHGWDKLIAEKDMATSARLKLYEDGNLSPVAHDQAVRGAVDGAPVPAVQSASPGELVRAEKRRQIIDRLVRSDVERLAQWELLWSKTIFHATGQVLDFEALVDANGNLLPEAELKKVFSGGVKIQNLESGVRCLAAIQAEIDKIKERLNLQKRTGIEQVNGQDRPESQKPLTIEDMRAFQAALAATPPEHQAVLVRMLKADERALQLLDDKGADVG